MRDLLRRRGAYSDEDIEQIVAAAREPGALTGMVAYYRAMLQRPTHTLWKPISRPVQVIWGEKDRFLLREFAEPDRRVPAGVRHQQPVPGLRAEVPRDERRRDPHRAVQQHRGLPGDRAE